MWALDRSIAGRGECITLHAAPCIDPGELKIPECRCDVRCRIHWNTTVGQDSDRSEDRPKSMRPSARGCRGPRPAWRFGAGACRLVRLQRPDRQGYETWPRGARPGDPDLD